jgi:hypothetical protein
MENAMRHSITFQMRSDKFAEAAQRLGSGGGLSGFARFYAMLASQERAIELEDDCVLGLARRDAPQEDAWQNEGGAANDLDGDEDYRGLRPRRS